ncbi:MAG: TonB family protein [Gammaproteobacteria bacterium]|nr:MAG: TonB family protein [Gammaproteobacteria bacterium]
MTGKRLVKTLLHVTAMACFFMSSAVFAASADDIKTAVLKDGSVLMLNGLGKAKQLSDDFYIGALYLPRPIRSADGIASYTGPKRMEIRIVAKRVSGRRLNQYWKDAITINNDKSIWQPQVRDVLAFANLFKKHNLTTGDTIDIDYLPGEGTLVYVNGYRIGRFSSGALYSLILNTWIGPRPPSSAFKIGIMGGNDSKTQLKLQEEFLSLSPSDKRIKAAKAWSEEIAAERARALAKRSPKVKSKEKRADQTTSEKKVAKAAKKEGAEAQSSKVKNVGVGKQAKNSKKKEVAKEKGEQRNNTNDKKDKATEEAVRLALAQAEAERKKLEEERKKQEAARLKALKIVKARSEYEDKLRAAIRSHLSYPIQDMLRNRKYRRMLEKGQMRSEGVIWLLVGRDGSVQSTRIEESTGISLLDKAAIRAVEKSDPLPAMPQILPEESFELLVRVEFVSPALN